MKFLIVLLISTLFLSCGGPPKTNTDYKKIIGTPIEINNLEIAQYDFPYKMDWNETQNRISELGDGWRLPALDEFSILSQNERRLNDPEFKERIYWSSTKKGQELLWNESTQTFDELAWTYGFGTGEMRSKLKSLNDVRVVRSK